jgi:hypothetical protein
MSHGLPIVFTSNGVPLAGTSVRNSRPRRVDPAIDRALRPIMTSAREHLARIRERLLMS